MRLVPGAQLGPHQIEAPLGASGKDEVFRAKDTNLGRILATSEALSHPNVVTLVIDFARTWNHFELPGSEISKLATNRVLGSARQGSVRIVGNPSINSLDLPGALPRKE